MQNGRAWAAGFFDGEGWVSAARYNRKTGGMTSTPVVGVGQAEPELLDRFQTIVGVGKVVGPHANGMCAFKAHGLDKVTAVAEALWPWLGTRKRDQFARVLDDAHEYRRLHPARRFSPEQVAEIRKRLRNGESQAEIGRSFGCDRGCINRIARGRAYAPEAPRRRVV